MSYFETKIKCLRQNENGLIKAVTEERLIKADGFAVAEHEATVNAPAGSNEIQVVSIKRSNVCEVVAVGDTELWHRVKFTYSDTDDGEKERKVTKYLLVNANDVPEADDRTKKHLETMLVPYEIVSIQLTKILEVIKPSKKVEPDGGREVVEAELHGNTITTQDGRKFKTFHRIHGHTFGKAVIVDGKITLFDDGDGIELSSEIGDFPTEA